MNINIFTLQKSIYAKIKDTKIDWYFHWFFILSWKGSLLYLHVIKEFRRGNSKPYRESRITLSRILWTGRKYFTKKIFEMLYAIWYHLYNWKKVKTSMEESYFSNPTKHHICWYLSQSLPPEMCFFSIQLPFQKSRGN